MINELTVVNQLRDVLYAGLNPVTTPTRSDPEPEPAPPAIPVILDFPSVDKMPAGNVVWMLPDYAEYEALATQNDRALLHVRIWILCKRAPKSDLITKAYQVYNQIYEILCEDTSLGGYVDFTDVTSTNFVEAVEENDNVQGVFASVAIQFTKDY